MTLLSSLFHLIEQRVFDALPKILIRPQQCQATISAPEWIEIELSLFSNLVWSEAIFLTCP